MNKAVNTKPPQSPFPGQKVDREIAAFVDALNSTGSDIVTIGSCCGHREKPAYVEVAVRGMLGLKRLVRILNRVDDEMENSLLLDVGLNWGHDVVTACDFENYPDWIMLSISIDGDDDDGPSPKVLTELAEVYRRHAARELCIGA